MRIRYRVLMIGLVYLSICLCTGWFFGYKGDIDAVWGVVIGAGIYAHIYGEEV